MEKEEEIEEKVKSSEQTIDHHSFQAQESDETL
jgi:hypothetical protein